MSTESQRPTARGAAPDGLAYLLRQTVDMNSVHEVLDLALEILAEVMAPTWCAIWLFENTTETWFISHSRCLSADAAELRFSRGSAIPCLVGEQGVAKRFDTLDDAGWFQRLHEEHYRMQSALYVPMTFRGRPVGVIALYSDKSAHFNDEDQSQLELFAAHLGCAVSAFGLFDESRCSVQPKIFEGKLSERENTVLRELALGRTNREIAQCLFIAESTVKSHVKNILQKLGVRNRVGAVLYASITSPPKEGLTR